MRDLSEDFMAIADVHIVVADKTFSTHSHFLAAESAVLVGLLRDIKPPSTNSDPWILDTLLEGYSTATVEAFLSLVYKPRPFQDVREAWKMLEIAEYLDCKRMLESARQILERCAGKVSELFVGTMHILMQIFLCVQTACPYLFKTWLRN